MKIARFMLLITVFSSLSMSDAVPVIAQKQTALPTLELRDVSSDDGSTTQIAWQSGLPLRSFDPQDRAQIDLSGTWQKERFGADADLTMSVRDETTLTALEAEIDGRQLADYETSHWDTITLPGVENRMPSFAGCTCGPEDYQNGVYYRRTLEVPAEWQGTYITLNFLAVNYMTDVWINGEWIGYHEGGFTPFSFDVTDSLQFGEENIIFIRLDNPMWGTRSDTVPAVKPDWWNYTGVIHDFYLESTPQLYIPRVDVLSNDTDGTISVQAVVHNTSETEQTAQFDFSIYTTDQESSAWQDNPLASSIIDEEVISTSAVDLRVPAGEVLVVAREFQIPDPALWSPADPNLYVLQATLSSDSGTDTFSTQFGIRTIKTDGTRLLLNGEPVFLAGIARHEEHPDTGRTMTWEIIRSDFELIQTLNANFVRTAHYPNHIYTYLLTDRLGLLVAEEIPEWQTTAMEYNVQAERQIADQMWREMIFSNRNRPSIILWSTNNESREVPARTIYNDRLIDDYRMHYDDGRLVMQSAAADAPGPTDSSQASMDVAGWTTYFGIFHGSTYYEGTRQFLLDAHEAFPDKPIVNTEYGIWSLGGGSSFQRQVEVFDETFRALTDFTARDLGGNWREGEDGFVAGITWWTAFDWYTAHTKLQSMGLYEMDRTTIKPVGERLREAYVVWSEE
jgi:beta-galactosidase